MINKYNKVLYTGVINNLLRRVTEHIEKTVAGFTSKYNVTKLVYYEEYATMEESIAREKQIKGGSRQKKIDLIKKKNPEWADLYDEFFCVNSPFPRHCEGATATEANSLTATGDCFVGKCTLLAMTKARMCWCLQRL
ncbi:MAG: GIY-YIG nuclease family protein [Chloroflexi bacterium]|nr:GIY-YIG nuclease family protein [Chloroflexota bacterium]